LTHGVTNYTADLAYTGESGGLNEGISDIFGIMCKQWINKQSATNSDWLIGEGMLENGKALRDMKGEEKPNPYDRTIFSYKDYKRGMDVHWTSGIANKAFYLTAKKIGGYSWEKAGKIWYIVLTQGWLSKYGPTIDGIPGRSFQEAADATFTVAAQLYGENSDEQNAVNEGWKGVDITPRKMGKHSIEERIGAASPQSSHKAGDTRASTTTTAEA
jgi:Zn-dependent metalloprotease